MLGFYKYRLFSPGITWASSPKLVPTLLVLLVNDSEYSKSTIAKPILSRGCIYLVSPGAEAGEANFSFPLRPGSAALASPFLGEKTFGGGKKEKNRKKKKIVFKRSGPIFSAAPSSPEA